MNHCNSFEGLVSTIKKLRDPDTGCPWDIKQTHTSLIKYLIEETFEAVDAIENLDTDRIKDELGDILLQVILHSRIAEESGDFDINDVIENINQKMIRRHPHVFSNTKVKSIDEVKKNWESIKKQENKLQDHPYTFSESILANTSLLSANKIGEKTNKLNFDWNSPQEVFKKVLEEMRELEEEIKNHTDQKRVNEEYGDLLFSIVQLGRHLNINPEISLRKANQKFIQRFTEMEKIAFEKGDSLEQYTKDQKEKIWKDVKQEEKK